MFIMLNPSKADAIKNDRTVNRCIRFAMAWGYGGLIIGNLFAYRSTKPDALKKVLDPVGPENGRHIKEMASEADIIIAAWGNPPLINSNDSITGLKNLHYLELTKSGNPRHPLYLKKILTPKKYTND